LHIVFVSGIGSLIFGGLGLGIYMVLENKVPEFLDFLAEVGGGIGFRRAASSDPMGMGGNYSSDNEIKLTKSDESMSSDFGGGDISSGKTKDGKFGDHIIINNIPIKNEPKLMAEAIRTIMSQDDGETPKQA